MYELSLALKYLIPRRSRLSASLIALLSVGVISLVVWLILVFLSVTEGIERAWLEKLTTLNAPLRITPTSQYYNSYSYQIDGVCHHSGYALKSIGEKMRSSEEDPYDALEDGELPAGFPPPDSKNPVKGLASVLDELEGITYQDFELSGALMRLQLFDAKRGTQSYLTQASYLATLPSASPQIMSVLVPPSIEDWNQQLHLTSRATENSRQDAPALQLAASRAESSKRMESLLNQVRVEELKTCLPLWQIPESLLPEREPFFGIIHEREGRVCRIDLPTEGESRATVPLWREGRSLFFKEKEGQIRSLPLHTPLLVQGPLSLQVTEQKAALFQVAIQLQGKTLTGEAGLEGLEFSKVSALGLGPAPWLSCDEEGRVALPTNEEKEVGVLLARSFMDGGVKVGDRGYLSYSSSTSSSLQEHRLPIFVSGFYDPGVLSIGNKCVFVPPFVTQAINASNSSFNLDKTQSNGILVWFSDLKRADSIKKTIQLELQKRGLNELWQVATYKEYDFAKDLLEQFQSDQTLFMLVGIIILMVGCCNIISMLLLLVNDKREEIGILQAMGAKRGSIALIFGSCGMLMGLLGSLIGVAAAALTLEHLDSLVGVLSALQGHEAFNPTFFGKSLPHTFSHSAILFVLIVTTLLSLIAGLIPAAKACRVQPSRLLRNT